MPWGSVDYLNEKNLRRGYNTAGQLDQVGGSTKKKYVRGVWRGGVVGRDDCQFFQDGSSLG